MGLITKLEVINQMLLTSGENLVSDLDNSSGIDTGIAETILNQCSLDFQIRGMANNKCTRKLNPTAEGYLLLPTSDGDEEGLISAELLSYHSNTDGYRIKTRLIMSSPARLWNITDDTDVFITADYYIEFITKLLWENLDTPIQRAIMASSVRHYQALTQGDATADQLLAYQESLFSIKGKAADINDKNHNIFTTGDSSIRQHSQRSIYSSDQTLRRFWRLL